MEKENQDYKLTEDQVKMIGEELHQNIAQNKNLKILADLPSNNGQEEHVPEEGKLVKADITVDPNTGEKRILSLNETKKDSSFDEKIENLAKSFEEANFDDYEISAEDVKNAVTSDDSVLGGDFDITEETTLELIKVINKFKETKKVTYRELPQQVKEYIDKYCSRAGIVGNSVQANTFRNDLADALISQYYTNIGLAKISDDFQQNIETLFDNLEEEVSPEIMNYNEGKKAEFEKIIESIEDEEKKKKAYESLESINDAYALTRFKEMAPKIKIKRIELEKPDRVFNDLHYKYQDSKFNIYNLAYVTNVIHKHLVLNDIIPESDNTSALKFTLAFCKLAKNYKVTNPSDHAFVHFFTHNIIYLDIYKAEQYDKFAPEFLKNVKEVIDLLK